MKRILSAKCWKYIAAFLIPLIFVMSMNRWLDNDSWYVLAEGRYIVENGVFYTDPLSMHEGLNVVVQNYGFAVVFYWIFSTFGAAGIYVSMLILNLIICFLLYKICMLLSKKNTNLSLLIMVLTDCVLALGFLVTRAQVLSFVFFLTLIYLLELYIKTDKVKYLFWIPLISIVQINMHASLWLMLILVILVYIIDSIRAPKLHLQGYRTKPLIWVGLISVLVALLNPYGLKMIWFILASYFNTTLKGLVVELQAFSPFGSIFEVTTYIALVIVLILLIFGKRNRITMRYLMMFFGFLALGLNTTKGMSQFILVMSLPLACVYRDFHIEKVIDAKIGRDALMFWCGLVVTVIGCVMLPLVCSEISGDPSNGLVEAVNAIDNDNNLDESKNVYAAYTGYDDGGYLEYRGYKPYIDPRGEYFLKDINGKEDILEEWDDFRRGKIDVKEFLEKYDFDYLLVRGEADPFYDLKDEDYEKLYEDEEYKIRVYKKRN